jgi:hypothetical protein
MEPVTFLPGPQPCAVCGQPTVTRKTGKRMRQPLHPGCDRRPVPALELYELVEVLTTLSNALGPLHLDAPPPPARPDQIGPCTRCRRPCRRYGEHAVTLCHRCDERTPPLTQLPLFPLGRCVCDHVQTVAEEYEPCPECLADPRRPHDCPVRTDPEPTG